MKLNYRKLILPAVIGLAVTIAPSISVFAVGSDNAPNASKESCSRVSTLSDANQNSLEAHMTALKSDYSQRLNKVSTEKEALDQKVATARADASAQFATKVADLEALTGLTEVQLQAVATFKTNMQTANADRAAAVDAARTAYRTALREFVTTQQQNLDAAAMQYQASVKTAFSAAVANCSDGGSMTTLRADIKTAREAMNSARKSVRQPSDVKALATTRNEAVQAANKAFATLAAQYSQTLQAALATTTATTH